MEHTTGGLDESVVESHTYEGDQSISTTGPIDIVKRARILAAVNSGVLTKQEFEEACRRSLYFFCAVCLYVYEPRSDDAALKDLPFIPRAFQRSYLKALQHHIEVSEDLLTDKTREMGVTWMVLMAMIWKWVFEPKFAGLVGSMTVDKIDRKGDPDSLFWKLEYLLESMNWTVPWLVPAGYHAGEPHRTYMKLINPQNGSVIRGEAMGPNFGRSGRSRVIFMDEFAEAEDQEATWASCSRTSDCRLVVFTPKGLNFAGRLANPKRGQEAAINKITLHWMLDETKNGYIVYSSKTGHRILEGHGLPDESILAQIPEALQPVYPWYEDAKRRVGYDPVKVAQELDVNYTESVDGIMYPQIERARLMRVDYDPSLSLYCAMDYGLSDETVMVWIQWDHRLRRFRVIDFIKRSGKKIHWFIPFLTGKNLGLGMNEGGYTPVEQEMINRHIAYQGRYTDWYGDPAGKQRNQVTNSSVIDILGRFGIYVRTSPKVNSHEVRHTALSMILPYCDFDEENCAELVDDIRASRFKTGADGKSIPMHGPESHSRTAMEFFAVNQPHGNTGALVDPGSAPGLVDDEFGRRVYVPTAEGVVEICQDDAPDALRRLTEKLRRQDREAEERWRALVASSGGKISGGWGSRR